MDTLYFLQHYWWALVSLLGAILVFLLFVQGMQSLLLMTARTDTEKDTVAKYAGHKWEITFTTLVTFGGAAFASFPLFYSTSFGGAYWLWICILLLFVIQAVSFEYRKAAGNLVGTRTFEIFLFLNGSMGTFLLGVAVGTFFTGGAFIVDKGAITDIASPAISRWTNPWHGIDAMADPFNWLMGITVFLAARTLGLMYLLTKPECGDFAAKCRKSMSVSAPAFVLCFAALAVWIMLRTGYGVDTSDGSIYPEQYKYLHNMIECPWIAAMLLIGTVTVITGLVRHFMERGYKSNFYITGSGTVLAVWAILLCAGFNDTAYYVSTADIRDSLTIYNSSSSLFTLKVMAYVSAAIPFVIAYIAWAWKKLR
ncbi:MAG TPA: cytochrome d ubiquinol oxidase subunit II [Candidatus Coprenecus stercoripullorum]|nr:cytochrome d ubiquinol oxidase subunit II [Candidatus Coprenecus stercoripullorum]